jgi:Ca2+-binding RTX toxin-like protein
MGGRHADTLLGQADADVLIGGRGFDVLVGGSGDDRVLGGRHADVLYAGAGEDILIGGFGRDVLYARAADGQVDRLHCGPGRDRAVVRSEDVADSTCERVTIVNGAETDPGDGEDVPKA